MIYIFAGMVVISCAIRFIMYVMDSNKKRYIIPDRNGKYITFEG